MEDSFNEAAAASARWEQRAKKAEQELVAFTRSQNDNLARARQVDDASDEAVKAARAEVEAKGRELLLRQAEKDRLVIKHREDLQRMHQKYELRLQAQTQASHSNEKVIHKLQAEHGEAITRLHEEHGQTLHRMQEEMQERSATSRLAAKDREIEKLHHDRRRIVDSLHAEYDSLKQAYERDKNIWSGGGLDDSPSEQYNYARGKADLSTDVREVQQEVKKLQRQNRDLDALNLSMRQHFEDKISRRDAQLASAQKDFEERYNAVETKRKDLENDKERYFTKWTTVEKKNKQLLEELKYSREVRPEWEKLREECPELREKVEELTADVASLTSENTKMLQERVFYVEALNKAQKDLDALRSLGHGAVGTAQRGQGVRGHTGGQLHRGGADALRDRQKGGRSKVKERAVERHGNTHPRFSDGGEYESAEDDDDTFVGGGELAGAQAEGERHADDWVSLALVQPTRMLCWNSKKTWLRLHGRLRRSSPCRRAILSCSGFERRQPASTRVS